MKETADNETCCESINADPSCSCSSVERCCGIPVGHKTLKTVICMVVLLAVVGIVGYKTIYTSSAVSNDTAAFAFGQPALETSSPKGNTIKAEQKFGEYVESLDELNTVAVDKDAVFVFIPRSRYALVDDKTKTAIYEVQRYLKRSDVAIGLYTLSCDSPEYTEITKNTQLPAILLARKGASAVMISGSNVDEYKLLQAYLACCDTSSGCCP